MAKRSSFYAWGGGQLMNGNNKKPATTTRLHLYLRAKDVAFFWQQAQQYGICQADTRIQELNSELIAIFVPYPPDTWAAVLKKLVSNQCPFYGESTSATNNHKQAFVSVRGVYRAIQLAPNGDLPICTESVSSFKASTEELRPFVALRHQCEQALQRRAGTSESETSAHSLSITTSSLNHQNPLPKKPFRPPQETTG